MLRHQDLAVVRKLTVAVNMGSWEAPTC